MLSIRIGTAASHQSRALPSTPMVQMSLDRSSLNRLRPIIGANWKRKNSLPHRPRARDRIDSVDASPDPSPAAQHAA
jgi:hypothetical protein